MTSIQRRLRAARQHIESMGHKLETFKEDPQDDLFYQSFCKRCGKGVVVNMVPRPPEDIKYITCRGLTLMYSLAGRCVAGSCQFSR